MWSDSDDSSIEKAEKSRKEKNDKNVKVKVNKEYAEKFDREERYRDLQRLKEVSNQMEDEESSDSEIEDEDAEALTSSMELQIVQTINSIRRKDPRIYDSSTKWCTENDGDNDDNGDDDTPDVNKSDKRTTFKDVLRQQLLENEDDDNTKDYAIDNKQTIRKGDRFAYDNEQEDIRKAFLKASKINEDDNGDSDSNSNSYSDSGNFGNILTLKNKNDKDVREEQLKKSLHNALGEMQRLAEIDDDDNDDDGNDDDDDDDGDDSGRKKIKKDKKEKKRKKTKDVSGTITSSSSTATNYLHDNDDDDNAFRSQKGKDSFLADYITGRKWLIKEEFAISEDENDHNYNNNSRNDNNENSSLGNDDQEDNGMQRVIPRYDNIDEEDDNDDEIDNFESKYNFRFEEDTQIGYVGHARNASNSLRRDSDTRKKSRESRKEKKEKERRQLEEELKRLKNIKRQELKSRFERINKVAGLDNRKDEKKREKNNRNDNGDDDDDNDGIDDPEMQLLLEEDWDQEKFDALMATRYDDDYYMAADEDGELQKWDEQRYDERDASDAAEDNYDENYGLYEDEDDGGWGLEAQEGEGEDDEYYNEEEDFEADDLRSVKKNKKKLAQEKFIEDQLYKMDFEDIVGGVKTRFKYKNVDSEDYGLDVDEILLADDNELNQVVSLKSFVPYNTYSNLDKSILHKKRKNFRQAIRDRKEQWYSEKPPQGYKTSLEEAEDEGPSVLIPKKKKHKKLKENDKNTKEKKDQKVKKKISGDIGTENDQEKKKRKRQRGNKSNKSNNGVNDADDKKRRLDLLS